MLWSQQITEKLADLLRFIVRAALMVSVIVGALAFSYVMVKLFWFTIRWLDRIWFSAPW
jgi:hypothetical protein